MPDRGPSRRSVPASRLAWHALLAPLPATAAPTRRELAPASSSEDAATSPIAGWSQLVVDLSAGPAGSRVILVVLDPNDTPLGASDLVYFRPVPADQPDSRHRQESIGGRFEEDGSFRGTCWLGMATGPAEGHDLRWELTPGEPLPVQVAALRSLVASVLARDCGTQAQG
jgi:hypothetical protein